MQLAYLHIGFQIGWRQLENESRQLVLDRLEVLEGVGALEMNNHQARAVRRYGQLAAAFGRAEQPFRFPENEKLNIFA